MVAIEKQGLLRGTSNEINLDLMQIASPALCSCQIERPRKDVAGQMKEAAQNREAGKTGQEAQSINNFQLS